MASHGGRYVIAFNGEIYNFRSLRAELVAQGHVFRGGSDTEVLLAAIEEHGLPAPLNPISGLFAFALGDRPERPLHHVPDQLGNHPAILARSARTPRPAAGVSKGRAVL